MSILTAADISTVMGLLASDAPIWVEDENGETRPISGVVVRNGQVRLQMAAKEGRPIKWDENDQRQLNDQLARMAGDPARARVVASKVPM